MKQGSLADLNNILTRDTQELLGTYPGSDLISRWHLSNLAQIIPAEKE